MLVLSRRRGEVITIGNGVTITVLAVQGERVKIGITAPAEVPVHRQEIHERIGGCSPELARAEVEDVVGLFQPRHEDGRLARDGDFHFLRHVDPSAAAPTLLGRKDLDHALNGRPFSRVQMLVVPDVAAQVLAQPLGPLLLFHGHIECPFATG